MGFLDNVTSAMNRGTATAERTMNTARLKGELKNLRAQRHELAAQLGASLYDAVKDDEAFRVGRERLFDEIAEIDRQRAAVEAEIAALEEQAVSAQAASIVYTCPKCGSKVAATHSFCSGCGLPIEQVTSMANQQNEEAIASGIVCATCGAPMADGDLFCMSCGARREEEPGTQMDGAEDVGATQKDDIAENVPTEGASL